MLAFALVLAVPSAASAAVDHVFVSRYTTNNTPNPIQVIASYMDGNTVVEEQNVGDMAVSSTTTTDALNANMTTAILQYATDQGYSGLNASKIVYAWITPAQVDAKISAAIPAAPSSYQTIVSQTGTAAPAVAGGMAPMNSYSGSPTFTWARSSAGVYTLTASSAVFNTSGKTGVFVAPLQNLNASVRATVTSSTVITVTTAVQSVAILGLLGLTATPTDALLSGTMIYVQTYP